MELGKLLKDDYVDKYDPDKFIKVYENMIVAKGGDGTLLKAINMYRHLNKPFYGLNAGTVGFLMNQKQPRYYDNLKVKKLNLIKVRVTHHSYGGQRYFGEDTLEFQAFNEVCIGGDMNYWGSFKVQEKDDFFGELKGGGLIICTPQGSTGINKSNGGTILPLSSNLWSITGDKTERPLELVLKPRIMNIGIDSRSQTTVWVDGANNIIENVISVELSKGDQVKVIFGNYAEFKKKRRT